MIDVAAIEPDVLAYIELVTGKRGEPAVLQWLKFSGWRDESDMPMKKKMEKNPVTQKLAVNFKPWMGARTQIPVEERMRRARAGASRGVRK